MFHLIFKLKRNQATVCWGSSSFLFRTLLRIFLQIISTHTFWWHWKQPSNISLNHFGNNIKSLGIWETKRPISMKWNLIVFKFLIFVLGPLWDSHHHITRLGLPKLIFAVPFFSSLIFLKLLIQSVEKNRFTGIIAVTVAIEVYCYHYHHYLLAARSALPMNWRASLSFCLPKVSSKKFRSIKICTRSSALRNFASSFSKTKWLYNHMWRIFREISISFSYSILSL